MTDETIKSVTGIKPVTAGEPQKETTKEPENNTVAEAGKASQVSKKSGIKSNIYWILGLVIAMVVASMVFSGSGSKKKNGDTAGADNGDYSTRTELEQNLAKINEQKKALQQIQAVTNAVQPIFTAQQPKMTREYVARQHAPTNMYEHAPEESSSLAGSAQNATLGDKSFNASFANQSSATTTQSAYRIAHPDYTIASGEFIHATLETAVSSDLPGEIRAVIASPVYAYIGETPLIPAGSRLIGQYSSAVLQGQNRIMVIWDRIILPNGIAINVSSPGADELGRAGQRADAIDYHFFARFGEAALLSLMGAGAAAYGVNTNDQNNSAAQYRMAIAESFQQSANQSLQGTLAIKQTLHIYQGAEINVFVAHDLSFYNVLHNA